MENDKVLKRVMHAARNNESGLDLSISNLASLPSEIKELKNLTALYLPINKLTALPPEIKELKNLIRLDLSGNKLTSLPPEIKELKNLTLLYLSENELTSLPPGIKGLKNLIRFDLSSNKLTSLPPEIKELKNLTELDLSRNQLTSLPPEITELKNLTTLNLYGNPLKYPPIEIASRGIKAIIDYFKSFEKGENQHLNEVKVLLVGDGGAGKTSLVKQLRDEEFDGSESSTHGINITPWKVKEGTNEIKVNFWDFGGQEIMHATHQFFLTKRSLYILVLDGRKEEDEEYWLKHIESFGGNSPILVVLNKIDENPSFDKNRPFLQEKYKGIKGFYKVSCKEKRGIKSFKENLKKELTKAELLKTPFAKNWFNVKTQLEHMRENRTDNFISYDQYKKICNEEKIMKTSAQDTLLDFLHDIGVILHFKDFPLKKTYVLEPKWVTEAVYKIINSEKLIESKGVLRLEFLGEILKREKETDYFYPPDKYKYIINLMKKFELCYEIDKQTVLMPDLLEIQEPKFDFDYSTSLKFLIEYKFLPQSVIPRFIVKRHKDIKKDLRWRTGVVLEDKALQSTAVIKADKRDKKVFIYINGDQKRDYCSIIRNSFTKINDSFEKLEFKELVPLSDNNEIAIEYEELIGYELERRSEYFVGKLRKGYNVKKLLNGIETEEERKKKHYSDKTTQIQEHSIESSWGQ